MTTLTSTVDAGTGIADLLADASFLHERLESRWVAPAEAADAAGHRRLQRWRERVGGAAALARQLDALGVDEAVVVRALSGARLLAVPDEPWARLLAEHLHAPVTDPRGWDQTPYGALLGPLTARAWAGLATVHPAALVAPAVLVDTLTDQVSRSAWWLGPALHRSFETFRTGHLTRLDVAVFGTELAAQHTLHDAFIAAAGPAGATLWRRRPVLARLAAQLATDQASFVRRVLRHLATDRGALAELLGHSPGRLVALRTGLGDRHEGGRSVCRLTFDDGTQVIYRPIRHDGLEILRTALRYLDDLPVPVLPAQLVRPQRCWVAYVTPEQVDDPVRYHRAAGVLLAVLHALGATDVHRDNLVPTAGGPSIVDAETVAHPVTAFETTLAGVLADRPLPATDLVRSVLRTGLVPTWDCAATSEVLDSAHLMADLPSATVITVPTLQAAGTDGERLCCLPAPLGARADLPYAGYDPAPWADVVASGFAEARLRIRADPKKWSDVVAGARVRLLHRYTRRYLDLLLQALRRPGLDGGVDLDVELAGLAAGPAPLDQSIVDAELADLRRLDVPYFTIEPKTRRLFHGGRPLGHAPLATAPESFALAPDDESGQRAVLRSALTAQDSRPQLSARTADELAGNLLTDLLRRAIPIRGDGLTWLGFEHRAQRFIRTPVGWSLYDGQAGIGLALAAGARALGHDGFAEAAVRTLRPLARRVLTDPGSFCRELGSGYLHGAAGVAWCLRHAVALLDDAGADAGAAARALEIALCAPAITGDISGSLELAGGLGGALVVLSEPVDGPLRASHEQRVSAVAQLTARVLDGPPAGMVVDEPGVAHGSAGVALGLLRAARLLATAESNLACELRAPLSQAAVGGAATALRVAESTANGHAWCTGRVGVDLVAAHHDNAPGQPHPLADGLTERVAASAPHHLCCGLVGSAVAVAATVPSARTGLLAATVDRLHRERIPRYLAPLPPGLHQPGLMQGAAGLALGLLLLGGARLPNPLAVTP